jgi:putative transposase
MIHFWKHPSQLNCSLNYFYTSLGTTKQAFHQAVQRSKRHQEEVFLMVELIKQIRADHPTMNCRAMYYKINPMYVGRDKFEAICRECGFSVEIKKNFRRTTDSSGVVRFENLLTDYIATAPDQAWSSDITYYEINGVFYYLTFILDNYSRRILGYNASSRLTTEQTTLPALQMAIKTRGKELKKGIIFHSDGGGQYYDDSFLKLTNLHNFKNSMCQAAWENGKAERINGIIKNNYLIPWGTDSLKNLLKNIDRAVNLYNHDKPHSGLGRMTPVAFEEKFSKLARQNKSTTKESIDKKGQNLRAVGPQITVQNKSQTPDIISKKELQIN